MQGVQPMPPPMIPQHDTNPWVVLLTGGGLAAAITGGFNYFTKTKERAAAKDKIEADAATGREKIAADAFLAKEKIEQEARLAKETRVDEGVWNLIKETRAHADAMRSESRTEIADMNLRVIALTEDVAVQKERASMAEVLTSVANLRADDADAERRELKARLSVAMVQIETLRRELSEKDALDHYRQKELDEMREKLMSAEKRLDSLLRGVPLPPK